MILIKSKSIISNTVRYTNSTNFESFEELSRCDPVDESGITIRD